MFVEFTRPKWRRDYHLSQFTNSGSQYSYFSTRNQNENMGPGSKKLPDDPPSITVRMSGWTQCFVGSTKINDLIKFDSQNWRLLFNIILSFQIIIIYVRKVENSQLSPVNNINYLTELIILRKKICSARIEIAILHANRAPRPHCQNPQHHI